MNIPFLLGVTRQQIVDEIRRLPVDVSPSGWHEQRKRKVRFSNPEALAALNDGRKGNGYFT